MAVYLSFMMSSFVENALYFTEEISQTILKLIFQTVINPRFIFMVSMPYRFNAAA